MLEIRVDSHNKNFTGCCASTLRTSQSPEVFKLYPSDEQVKKPCATGQPFRNISFKTVI